MSEVRLNIIDSDEAINGTVHGSEADVVIAALSAEPETIAELEAALERFIKRVDDRNPFQSFRAGVNLEPWDAGLIIVDLAARLAAIESSYSKPEAHGAVRYHDGFQATDIWLQYRLPDDWLFITSALEYEALADSRRLERAANPSLDVRQVLYGRVMTEFIVKECLAARVGGTSVCGSQNSIGQAEVSAGEESSNREPGIPESANANPQSDDAIAGIHARWLMTPRADLRELAPRDVIIEKLDFIDFDLQYRAQQWSFVGEGPPPLPRDSYAYRFAGFGTHEYVVYYKLLRRLLGACWERVLDSPLEERTDAAGESAGLVEMLEAMKAAWLNEPQDELEGRIPSALIESEHRRIPITLSSKEMMIDENCDLCRLMSGETGEDFGPGFWHLDGSGMDDGFEFSTHRTREEWEAEQRKWREHYEEFNRRWAAEHGESSSDSECQ